MMDRNYFHDIPVDYTRFILDLENEWTEAMILLDETAERVSRDHFF